MIDGRERRYSPAEGWSVVVLVAILGLIVATAIDEPAWVNGRGYLTDGLATCASLGAFVGFVGPKVGWGRWRTHIIGALFAGLLIPVLAGWAVQPGIPIAEAFRVTAKGSVEAYLDLSVRGRPFTTQEVHYVLVLGGILWGTLQFGSFAVFGHRRPFSAVIVVGLVLLANMALTRRDQLGWLVLYAAVSLFLLIQMHAVDERATWLRRRIGEPGSVSSLYLRGGTIFVVAAMAGSLVLTTRAASSPLAGAWTGLDTQLVQIGLKIGQVFPVGGDLRGGGGVAFGSSFRVAPQWFSDDGVAFAASVPSTAGGLKWRAATYDSFVLSGWEQTDLRETALPASAQLLAASAEDPTPDLTTALKFTVKPSGYHDTKVLSLGIPTSLNVPSTVSLTGSDGWFAGVDVAGNSSYAGDAAVLNLEDTTGITANELAAASRDYPPEISARYTAIPPEAIGPDAQVLLATILKAAPSHNPYDLAKYLQDYLQTGPFRYTTDVRDIACDSPSTVVECFARTRVGYCLYYASTMAILLRAALPDHPIPTRLVQGFLPGALVGTTETVLNRNAHAWVEVYFPGYGWIPFDPTGGGVGRPTEIAPGPSVAPAPSGLVPARTGFEEPRPTRQLNLGNVPGSTGGPAAQQPGDRPLFIVLAALLAVIMGGLIVMVWWRGPRGEVTPEGAWTALGRVASRFGFAPRPTQTVYEYAETLGALVPVARPDLRTVADAKVEVAYARANLAPDRQHAVRVAMRRLRVSLLRLVLMRIGRRGRRRR